MASFSHLALTEPMKMGIWGGTHGYYTNYNELYIYIHKHLNRYLWVHNDAGYVAIWLTWGCHMWVLPKSGDECKEHGAILVFPTGYMHAYSQEYWMDLIQTWGTIQFMALFSLTITSMINQRFGVPYFQTPMWVSHGFCQHINIANLWSPEIGVCWQGVCVCKESSSNWLWLSNCMVLHVTTTTL